MEQLYENGIAVVTGAAVTVPAHFALPALETILKAFEQEAERASLALNMRQMHLPFEATICVGIHAHVLRGEASNEWRLNIRAERNPGMYPTFQGVLTLVEAGERGSELRLHGRYTAPLGAGGYAIDTTLLRDAAKSSLERFVREIAYRIAALARWAAADAMR